MQSVASIICFTLQLPHCRSSRAGVKDLISFTTFNMNPMKFNVALNKSYTCMRLVSLSMEAELHKSNEHPLDPGLKLANATLTLNSVQLDAFRAVTVPAGVFQTPSSCAYP